MTDKIELYGLTAAQKQIADKLWKCRDWEDLTECITNLPQGKVQTAWTLVWMIQMDHLENTGEMVQYHQTVSDILSRL